jgi:copper resistance protein C
MDFFSMNSQATRLSYLLPLLALSVSTASAHAILVKSDPSKEAVLTVPPREVHLTFNDAVGEEYLALAVIDATGNRVDGRDARLDFTDHAQLRASVGKLAKGQYLVRYRVLSADGHVVSGKYGFSIQ